MAVTDPQHDRFQYIQSRISSNRVFPRGTPTVSQEDRQAVIFNFISSAESREANADISALVIAGWTGRDAVAVQHHIDELARLGVPAPSRVPLYYRASAHLLTQESAIEVVGAETSGEAEPALLAAAGQLWVGVGSDHTDRKAEAFSVALSKQLCAKPLARTLWRFVDVAPHWDELMLRSWAVINGKRVLYQEGRLALIRPPLELVRGYTIQNAELAAGTAMFCGTLTAIGGVRPASRFEMQLEDPVLKREIRHSYEVSALPVVS